MTETREHIEHNTILVAETPGGTERRSFRKWLVIYAAFLVTLFFYALYRYIASLQVGDPMQLGEMIVDQIPHLILWGISIAVLIPIARLNPLTKERFWISIFTLLAAGILIVFFNALMYLVYYEIQPWYSVQRTYLNTSASIHSPGDALRVIGTLNLFFRVAVYLVIVAVCYAYDYALLARDREIQAHALETALANAQLQALKMQIQPHFLFNTLNSMNVLVREDPDAASTMITALADILRIILRDDARQEVPLSAELDLLEKYVTIEQMRFRDRLTVEWTIDHDALKARVPYLFLQPLVENSIRHGISNVAGPGLLTITARKENNELRITVADNGAGFQTAEADAAESGIGLSNVRARLVQLYGANHRIEIQSLPGRGTTVSVVIPFLPVQ